MTIMSNTQTAYKQTEVGLIPSDWEVNELGTILTFGSGRDYKHLQNGEIPVYGTGGVMTYVDDFIYEGESVGIGRKGTIDKPVFLNGKFWTVDTLFYTHQFINSNPRFIYYKFILIKWKEYNEASGVPSLNKNTLQKIKIGLPTLAEQTAIATALSDADALISSLEKLIAKKRNIKQGAMQKLLQPKEGWEVKKLGEIGKCHRGVSYNPERDLHPHDKNITVRLLRSNNVQNQNIDLNGLQYVDQERVKQNQLLQDNDIVICMANGSKQLVGKSAIFKVKDKLNYTFGAFMGCFRTNVDLASSSYIALNFQSFQYRNYIDVLLSGSSINNLNPGNIESIEIPFPSKEEQTRIANILSDMNAEISALETKLEKYRKVKLGMMQNLLTGKIRLI
jgi:type I restriction enzyme, S subunit